MARVVLGLKTHAMFGHSKTPLQVKDYQNLSLGAVLIFNAGHVLVSALYKIKRH